MGRASVPVTAVSMAASTRLKLLLLTPLRPMAWKSCAISATAGTWPRPICTTRSAMLARFRILEALSTLALPALSRMSLNRPRSASRPMTWLKPRAEMLALLRAAPVPSVPSASARILVTASTRACTLAGLSTALALMAAVSSIWLMRPTLALLTPVTPA